MTSLDHAFVDLSNAKTIGDLQEIVDWLSACATSSDGVFYSRNFTTLDGTIAGAAAADALATSLGASVIDQTDRGRLLSDRRFKREMAPMFVLRDEFSSAAKDLTKVEGPDGDSFFVSWLGLHPQAEFYFFYGDERCQFVFYVRTKMSSGGREIDVHDATVGILTGGRPVLLPPDVSRIERNIAKLFQERSFVAPAKPAAEVISHISFTWRLGK